MSKAPFIPLNLAPTKVEVENLSNGVMILRSPQKLGNYLDQLGFMLKKQAESIPDQIFLAERDENNQWRKQSYAQIFSKACSVSQALLGRGFLDSQNKAISPVMILSDNSINSAIIQLGAMQIGIPVVPVSPAYSLMSKTLSKLHHIVDLIEPKLIYVEDGQLFSTALKALDLSQTEVFYRRNQPEIDKSTPVSELTNTQPTGEVEAIMNQVGPDHIAKILFTSGSTGMPKGVINTHRMLCSNQQANKQLWPFVTERKPVILDWLPWNHTFGGNFNFNLMLFNGGTIYIDNGKPAPGLLERTVNNLREISPTMYFNVPRGFDMLLPFLEKDTELRDKFFKHLDVIFYAAAALPQNLWERLEKLSIKSRGERVLMLSAWGSTETAPMATSVHFPIEQAGVIGLPAPGTAVKLVPNQSKLELRLKGPNITPGYWKNEEETKKVFDEEGYYCIGDAGKLADNDAPEKGMMFDGRISENFKLTTGTWVHTGSVRIEVVASGEPVIQDAAITGHNQNQLGLLVFPNIPACQALCSDTKGEIPLEDLIKRPEVISKLKEGIQGHNQKHPESSFRIKRALIMVNPPSIDANEITDKGYLNQRAILEQRNDLVEKLYEAGSDDRDVIFFD